MDIVKMRYTVHIVIQKPIGLMCVGTNSGFLRLVALKGLASTPTLAAEILLEAAVHVATAPAVAVTSSLEDIAALAVPLIAVASPEAVGDSVGEEPAA